MFSKLMDYIFILPFGIYILVIIITSAFPRGQLWENCYLFYKKCILYYGNARVYGLRRNDVHETAWSCVFSNTFLPRSWYVHTITSMWEFVHYIITFGSLCQWEFWWGWKEKLDGRRACFSKFQHFNQAYVEES